MDFSATTEPISAKVGVWIDIICQSTNLKIKTTEVHNAELLPLNQKCHFLGNRWYDFNHNWCVDGYKCTSLHLKNQDDRGAQHRDADLSFP